MSANTCDRLALGVAKAIHEKEKPQATLLFGSRARGDHNETCSDIDVLVVGKAEPDSGYKETLSDWANERARAAYGRPVPVQITWRSAEEFREELRYVNSVATHALLEGVLMSHNPEDYRSRYAAAENAEYAYDWTNYDNRLHHAEAHLRGFLAWDDLGEEDLLLGQQAHAALEHSMKALIAAHGETCRNTHNLAHLLGTIRRIDPAMADFSLSISPDIYSEYSGDLEYRPVRSNPRLTEQPDYRRRTVNDIQALTGQAREARRNRRG